MEVNIGDLAGISQPATKLIEVASAGLGTLYRPRAIRKEGEAEAARILAIETAKAQATEAAKDIAIHAHLDRLRDLVGDDVDVIRRAKTRLAIQEVQGQINIEAIVDESLDHLPSEVTNDPVSTEFSSRFFKYAADVSEADMQRLWARVLAGEVAKPGTFSVRTLDTIHTLSRQEAELFARFADLCFVDPEGGIPLLSDVNVDFSPYGLKFADVMKLRDAGLLSYQEHVTYSIEAPGSSLSLRFGEGFIVAITPKDPKRLIPPFHYTPLTSAGRELVRLLKPQTNLVHVQRALKKYEAGHNIVVIGGQRADDWAKAYDETHKTV